jgi:hypothetical protein
MAEQTTAGYKFYYGTIADGDLIGIVRESDPTWEGDDEEVSGLNDTTSENIIRQKHLPVDVNGTLSLSGIVDRDQTGYDDFHSAMKNRAQGETLGVERPDGSGVNYTGHSTSYNPETVTRDEATAKFSLEFQVNSDEEVTAS